MIVGEVSIGEKVLEVVASNWSETVLEKGFRIYYKGAGYDVVVRKVPNSQYVSK
jgi:hypothetical protein